MDAPPSHSIDISFVNTPAALPRLLLVFSRRRIRVRSMVLEDSPGCAFATLRMTFDVDGPIATAPGGMEGFMNQLRRVVEVDTVVTSESDVFQASGRAAA